MRPELSTVADVLPQMAATQPDTTAIFFPTKQRDAAGDLVYTKVSYRELDERSSRIAAGLSAVGIERGHRAALMVRPSPELFALTFGMFKAGVVPVMIDPGLGIKGLSKCLARAEPSAFIGIPVAHAARIALGWGRATVERTITVGGWGLAKHTLVQVEALVLLDHAGDRAKPGDRLETDARLVRSFVPGAELLMEIYTEHHVEGLDLHRTLTPLATQN